MGGGQFGVQGAQAADWAQPILLAASWLVASCLVTVSMA
jgi:hypothetical protein